MTQELAHHSTPTLTIGRYAHTRFHDLEGALEALPSLSATAGNVKMGRPFAQLEQKADLRRKTRSASARNRCFLVRLRGSVTSLPTQEIPKTTHRKLQ